MIKRKVLFVFGTRPEAIKMAPVIDAFHKQSNLFEVIVCSTGQHKEMLDQVINFFKIKVDYKIKVMRPNQNLSGLSSKIISEFQKIIDEVNPNYLFVHGDTSTTAMTSLVAFYNNIKLCHIEAGLRTNNKLSPFPEEINRRVTGLLADYHFSPTTNDKKNLLLEGVSEENIFVCGNTVIDSLMNASEKVDKIQNDEINLLEEKIDSRKKIVLVTSHRRENYGKNIKNICDALKKISGINNTEIVYPVHLNPNINKIVNDRLDNHPNIHLVDPLSYPSFIWLMKKSYIILTDSGGIQEEAPSLGIPVVVMRDTTERMLGVEAGTAILSGSNPDKIFKETKKILSDKKYYDAISKSNNPYGDGNASNKILNNFIEILENEKS